MYLLGVVPLVYCMPKSMEMRIVFCCTDGIEVWHSYHFRQKYLDKFSNQSSRNTEKWAVQWPICTFPAVHLISVVWLWGQRGGVKGTEQLPDAPSPVLSPPNSQCCTDTWGRGNDLSGDVPAATDTLRCVVFRMEKTKDLTAAETCG